MLNIKNTTDGYLKDIEIKGNTIQDAENLADIRSVGDKVEGQELYKIPVLSTNKNLFDGYFEQGTIDVGKGTNVSSTKRIRTLHIKVKPNTNYVLSFPNKFMFRSAVSFDENLNVVQQITRTNFTTLDNEYYIRIIFSFNEDIDIIPSDIYDVQLEEGTQSTPYEPYQEDKLTILSPVQLEKVGDVRDRIICKDGVWGVEKNIKTTALKQLSQYREGENVYVFHSVEFVDYVAGSPIMCNTVPTGGWHIDDTVGISGYASYMYIRIPKADVISYSTEGANDYISRKQPFVKYQTTEPIFIPLPHDQQIKLRTFAGQTNIHFETEIQGTIKAQVPKSLGATVNSHTEQICNLSKELDRVKKLEESTVSTVVSESDFTTVEETSNGYFEDVKLEGKTLVNLCEDTPFIYSQTYPNRDFTNWKMLKPDTEYTFLLQGDTSNLGNILISNSKVSEIIVPKKSYGHIFKFRTPSNIQEFTNMQRIFIYSSSDAFTEAQVSGWKLAILEGDHTNNPPEYFEGLKSVGEDVDEASVKSVNENLLDLSTIEPKMSELTGQGGSKPTSYTLLKNGVTVTSSTVYTGVMFRCKLKRNYTYTISWDSVNAGRLLVKPITPNNIYQYNATINTSSNTPCTFTTTNADEYWVIFDNYSFIGDWSLTNIMLVEGTSAKPYTPHQSDKKQLLYYNNETQTWEKPILRQWDSIEKHSDGKYYYHKRSGEVVLNGSEDWDSIYIEEGYIWAYSSRVLPAYSKHQGNYIFNTCISDKLNTYYGYGHISDEYVGNSVALNERYLKISLSDNVLPSVDKEGIAKWLQANNVTVVYQLAQEEVYECTNIDLITYENETNYIVSSGAIAPKTTLKVHNNISNVVKILQEKVNLLESNVIASQEVQDMMILESDLRILDIELALMEHMPITLNLGENIMLRSATYFNFIKGHIVNETYSKDYLENVMNKYLTTNRLTQEEYDELYKLLYPPVYDIALPIEE